MNSRITRNVSWCILLSVILLGRSYLSNTSEYTHINSQETIIKTDLSTITLQVERSFAVSWASSVPCIADVDTDGIVEIVTGGYSLGYLGNTEWSSFEFSNEEKSPPIIIDLDSDGNPEIVFGIKGGIVCLDDSGNELWKYVDGSHSSLFKAVCVEDIDNDGFYEIVASTDWDGVYCINRNGLLEWQYEDLSTGKTGEVAIFDLDNNGFFEVIFGHGKKLVCLDYDSTLRWEHSFTEYVTNCLGIANFNETSSEMEIIISTYDELFCFNSTGSIEWNNTLSYGIYRNPVIGNVDVDSSKDIVLCSDAGRVYCFNNTGGKIWETNLMNSLLNTSANTITSRRPTLCRLM